MVKLLRKNEVVKNIIEVKKVVALLLIGNMMFDSGDRSQTYFVFQPVHKYIQIIANTKYISEWKSKESIF